MENWVDLDGLLEVKPFRKWSKRFVYYLARTGQIPHFKPTRRKLLFNLDEIEKWLINSKVESGDDS